MTRVCVRMYVSTTEIRRGETRCGRLSILIHYYYSYEHRMRSLFHLHAVAHNTADHVHSLQTGHS